MSTRIILSMLLIGSLSVSQGFISPQQHHHHNHHLGPVMRTRATTSNTQLYGLLNRFRKKREIKQPELIKVGDTLPNIDVQRAVDGAVVDIRDISTGFVAGNTANDDEDAEEDKGSETPEDSASGFITKKKSILVGMPGAFTPVCSAEHLPGFMKNAEKFRQLGYGTIAVVTTNDRYVNAEWLKSAGLDIQVDIKASDDDDDKKAVDMMLTEAPVTILCDADGDLVKEMGLAEDMGFGVGVRSKRFCLTVDEDGKVTNVLTDEGMDDCSTTSAVSLLNVLSPDDAVRAVGDGNAATVTAVAGGLAVMAGIGYYLYLNQ